MGTRDSTDRRTNFSEELGGPPIPFTVPSAADALDSDALSPENILAKEEVHYEEVFFEFNPELV